MNTASPPLIGSSANYSGCIRNRGCIRDRGLTRHDRLISELSVIFRRESLVHHSDCYEFPQQVKPIGCGRHDEEDEADETDEEDEAEDEDDEDKAGEGLMKKTRRTRRLK